MDSGKNAPPQPPGRRSTWRIRAIVTAAAAVAVMAVAYGIVNASNRVDPLDSAAGAQPTGAAAVAKLRAQLPPHLRSAKECVETAPEPKALATIICVWAKTHVPSTAIYSLFADNAAMLESAESRRSRGGHRGPGRGGGLGEGTSCDTADDFKNGGKTTWQSDNRERGTLWCYLNKNGEPECAYTDSATSIAASATAAELQQVEQLLGWFHESGQPEPSPQPTASAGSPSPSSSTAPTPTREPTAEPTGGPETTEPGLPKPEPEPKQT